MTTVYLGKKPVRLDDRDLLGEGGEGRVYRAGDRAIKVFLAPSPARKKKLLAFPAQVPARVIGPLELCTDRTGEVVGYAMRRLDGAVDAHRLSHRKWREAQMRAGDVLRIWSEVSEAVAQLHARGLVVGDLNDGNVVLTREPSGLSPWLIDADSMQLPGHPCVVAHERFLDPRLYGVDLGKTCALSKESDWYALAVLAFASLVFVHPFGGTHPSHPTMLRRAEARHSVLRGDVKLPASSVRPDVLPDDALSWFVEIFERDVRAPLPARLLDARFAACSCGLEHARRSCPRCTARALVRPTVRARGKLRATTVFRTSRGRIVAASATRGRLEHAYVEDGALRREDGELVTKDALGPLHTVRVAGTSTWVGTDDRMIRHACGRVAEGVPVPAAHGELAGDAGPAGLVHVSGDSLVRASDGTRIGQVLEGQTRVRVGGALGFAFYRAGAITVSFVFDVRRGPLRQVALPNLLNLEGRLVDWSATFDEHHVLVTFATEASGRVLHTAHLVDDKGEIIASERGAPDASPVLASLGGKCLGGGAVMCATDEGLVLVRPDRARRAFVPVRSFADAKDLVSPDDELLLGPGGSLYVISHDEIVHLSFTETT